MTGRLTNGDRRGDVMVIADWQDSDVSALIRGLSAAGIRARRGDLAMLVEDRDPNACVVVAIDTERFVAHDLSALRSSQSRLLFILLASETEAHAEKIASLPSSISVIPLPLPGNASLIVRIVAAAFARCFDHPPETTAPAASAEPRMTRERTHLIDRVVHAIEPDTKDEPAIALAQIGESADIPRPSVEIGNVTSDVRAEDNNIDADGHPIYGEPGLRSRDVKTIPEAEAAYRYSVQLSGLVPWTASADGAITPADPSIGANDQDDGADPASGLEHLHPDDQHLVESARQRSWQTGNPLDHIYRCRAKDGTYRWWRARAVARRNESGDIVRWYGTFENVDADTRRGLKLDQLQAQMIHLSRVNAMATMASTLAHELNQPLAALLNYVNGSQRLLDHMTTGDTMAIRNAMNHIEGCAIRAAQIIRQARQQVARNRTDYQNLSVANLIRDACSIALINTDDLGIRWQVKLDPEVRKVWVDGLQMQQALINLLWNAVDAVGPVAQREIVVSTRGLPNAIEIAVADSGVGVDPAIEDRIFEPFKSTKIDGSGIGLSISRTIVEAHGGQIGFTRLPTGGTQFRITLPSGRPEIPSRSGVR